MGLTAATYLGDNTVPILGAAVAVLADAGIDISVDPSARRDSAHARLHAADVDLVWMCGSLAIVLIDQGVLPHHVVAAPVFDGETAAVYRSVLVTRRQNGPTTVRDALSGTVAVNEPESWSGHHGLRRHLGATWFSSELVTGSHRQSVEAVAAGRCDLAAIDVTVWHHLGSTEPGLVHDLQVIDRTTDWPSPPFLIHPRCDAGIRERLEAGITVAGLVTTRPAGAEDYRPLLPDPPPEPEPEPEASRG